MVAKRMGSVYSETAYVLHFVSQQKLLVGADDHFNIRGHRLFRMLVVRVYLHLLLRTRFRLC